MIWTVSFRRTKKAPLEHTVIAERTSDIAWKVFPWVLLGLGLDDYYSAECYEVPMRDLFDPSTAEFK